MSKMVEHETGIRCDDKAKIEHDLQEKRRATQKGADRQKRNG